MTKQHYLWEGDRYKSYVALAQRDEAQAELK